MKFKKGHKINKGRKLTAEHKKKISESHLREKHPNWKGGKRLQNGYFYILIEGNYIREHRYLMEKFIGRKLEPNEMVHHINGIKTDNRLGNLQIVDIVEHGRIHGGQHGGKN